ncbi:MAG: Sec-independent protein translocase subunit TatA [Mycobacteriales bacterium]
MLEFLEKPGVVIVILLAIVVFGAKRLPDSARALGRSMRILKAEAKGLKDDDAADQGHAPAPKQLPETATPSTTESSTGTADPTQPSQQSPHQT